MRLSSGLLGSVHLPLLFAQNISKNTTNANEKGQGNGDVQSQSIAFVGSAVLTAFSLDCHKSIYRVKYMDIQGKNY